MFDIGFWELVFLFGLGLLVLGPERMPQVAAKLGRWAGQARQMARHLTSQIRDEIEPIQSSMDSMQNSMQDTLDETIGDTAPKPRKDWSAQRPEPGQSASSAPTEASADANTSTDKDA